MSRLTYIFEIIKALAVEIPVLKIEQYVSAVAWSKHAPALPMDRRTHVVSHRDAILRSANGHCDRH